MDSGEKVIEGREVVCRKCKTLADLPGPFEYLRTEEHDAKEQRQEDILQRRVESPSTRVLDASSHGPGTDQQHERIEDAPARVQMRLRAQIELGVLGATNHVDDE